MRNVILTTILAGALLSACGGGDKVSVVTPTVTAALPTVVTAGPTNTPGQPPTPAPTAAPVPTATPTALPVGLSRTSPAPVKTLLKVGGWVVGVEAVTPNANQAVLARNQFNKPPAAGRQFFMVTVSATYDGEKTSSRFGVDLTMSSVGAANVQYNYADDCGVTPEELPRSTEVFKGGTIKGNLCWSVRTTDVETLVMYGEPSFSTSSARAWWALR